MQWRYSIGFLLAGNYEVAYTCNGDLFAPLAGKPAEIMLEQVTTVDFLAEDAPGSLVGTVDGVFFNPDAPESGFCDMAATPMVYVFDDGVAPSFDVDAVATAEVSIDTYGYSIPLMAANYNAAFTCTGTDFIPADGKPAEVLPGAATELNFLADDAPPPVGSMSGKVALELAEAESCTVDFVPKVYVFGKDVIPNTDDTPVAMGEVTVNSSGEAYEYLIEDLLAVTYSAAFTCTGTDFVPVAGKEAVITIGENTTLDFVATDAEAAD
jgi:hypothetical protein